MVIDIVIGVFTRNVWGWDTFWPKKSGFAKEANVDPKTAISATNIQLHATTCLSFNKTYNHILNTVVDKML